jgi:hypothetical protein
MPKASEYRQFQRWTARMEAHLRSQPASAGAVEGFLLELAALNGTLMEVCDGLASVSRGNWFDVLRNLKTYALLFPDPLRFVRLDMRAMRSRYGEVPGWKE